MVGRIIIKPDRQRWWPALHFMVRYVFGLGKTSIDIGTVIKGDSRKYFPGDHILYKAPILPRILHAGTQYFIVIEERYVLGHYSK